MLKKFVPEFIEFPLRGRKIRPLIFAAYWRLSRRLLSIFSKVEYGGHYKISRKQLASAQDLENIDQLVKSRGTARSDILTVTTFPLQNAAVSLRAGTSDAVVYYETFLGLYHIPPRLPATVETLLDLGANIGLTAAHYCVLFPTCRILAVEPDQGCVELAIQNTRTW